MNQYLVVLLDDLSVAYCHADNPLKTCQKMTLETLKQTIKFGMKQNLMIQFILPTYKLESEYYDLMDTIDHVKIGGIDSGCNIDVCVYDYIPSETIHDNVVVRIPIVEFIDNPTHIFPILRMVKRLTINFRGITEDFDDSNIERYQSALGLLSAEILNVNQIGYDIEINILTDRLSLYHMNNCNPGISNITVAPNGELFLCPAFYYDHKLNLGCHSNPIGDIIQGIDIPNQYLLKLSHAPICRTCNAYHCKRCIWLNSKTTLEVNTPSHQQCIISNIEHNASYFINNTNKSIGNIDNETLSPNAELDPFYTLINS